MKYKLHILLIIAVLPAIAVISCQPKAAKFKGTKIRLMQCCGETRDIPAVSSAITRIKKELKVIVDTDVSPAFNPYFNSILSQAEISEPADVLFVTSSDFIKFLDAGLVEDLSPYIMNDREIDITDYHSGAVDYFTRENAIYAIPRDIEPLCAVYYNKQIFDEAGVDYPDDGWDIETFLNTAKKLIKSDSKGRIIQFGFVDSSPYWKPWIYAHGGRLVNEIKNPTKCFLGSKESLQAVQFRGALINKHSIMPTYAQIAENNASKDRSKMFTDGKTAMYFGPLENSGNFSKIKSFDWDIVLFPSLNTPTAKAYHAECSGFAIHSRSKNKEAAWELIKYLTDRKTQEELAAAYYVPSLTKVLASSRFLGSGRPKNKGAVLKAMPHIIFPPSHINWDEAVMSEIEPALDSVWKDTEPASIALGRIIRTVDKYYLNKK